MVKTVVSFVSVEAPSWWCVPGSDDDDRNIVIVILAT